MLMSSVPTTGMRSIITQTCDSEDHFIHLPETLRAHAPCLSQDTPQGFTAYAAMTKLPYVTQSGLDHDKVFLNELEPYYVFSALDVSNDTLTQSQMM